MFFSDGVADFRERLTDLCGFTARIKTFANFATSGLNAVVFAPVSLANAAQAASLTSLAMISFGVTDPRE